MRVELAPGDRIAGCVIEGELGRGGMGVVYRARQESLQRTVAVKVVSPALVGDAGFAERFKREARIAASIEHASVVPIYGAGEEDGRLYLVMRFVEGTDLFAEVAGRGPLAPQRVARLAGQLAGALDAAHARGLVHRDVKPANVLLTGTGDDEHALLTDFGLSKEAAGVSGLTGTGQLLGTLDYVAPEQLDDRPVDARTDVYALGCLLFECLTGRVPFPGSPAQKVYAHLHMPPPALEALASGAARQLDGLLARAMAKEPDQRYPSAGDLGRALAAAVDGRDERSPERSVAAGAAATQTDGQRPTVIDPPPSPRSGYAPADKQPTGRGRRTALVAAALVALAAAGITGGVLVAQSDQEVISEPPGPGGASSPSGAPLEVSPSDDTLPEEAPSNDSAPGSADVLDCGKAETEAGAFQVIVQGEAECDEARQVLVDFYAGEGIAGDSTADGVQVDEWNCIGARMGGGTQCVRGEEPNLTILIAGDGLDPGE